MRVAFLLSFLLPGITVMAQTREIAFKSHSGHANDLKIAMTNERFDPDRSDFGMAPTRSVQVAQLDSVIFLSDSAAIMVTSNYCHETERGSNRPALDNSRWSAGRRIVYLHPLFSRQHALDSIKEVLRLQYYFKRNIDSTIFVGYDNGLDSCSRNAPPIVLHPRKNAKPVDSEFLLILCCIIGSAGMGGGLGYVVNRKQWKFVRA